MRELEQNSAGGKITRDELRDLFGDEIPMEVIALIWNAPGQTTLAELRRQIREMAAAKPEPVDPLREAVQAAILEADRDHAEGTTWIDDFVKGLRARGVTMEKNNG